MRAKNLHKSEVAEMCSVSRPAIGYAVRKGILVQESDGRININARKNAKYIQAKIYLKDHPSPNGKPQRVARVKESDRTKPTASDMELIGASEQEALQVPPTEVAMSATKIDVEIARIKAQTTKLNMEIAEKSGRFFLKEQIISLFGDMSSTFSNLIHPLGQRLAGDLCDLCGITDPKIILAVQAKMELEHERAILEFKRICSEPKSF